MSQENVEIVRKGFEAWNAGDMEALRDLYDPGVVLRPVADWPEPGPFLGREAVMRQWEQMRETWEIPDQAESTGEFIEVADHVLVRFRWRTAGRGPDLNLEQTILFTVRSGKIFLLEYFWDHAEALKVVGLEE